GRLAAARSRTWPRRSLPRSSASHSRSLRSMSPPTLLVIDVQRAWDDPAWPERNNPDAEARVAELLAAWRGADAPIVHVRHESAESEGLFLRGPQSLRFNAEAPPPP